jgi:hypothetical protein
LKSSRPIKDVCAHKCRRPNSYYLGLAESPTSDSFSVWLKSSRSDSVASPPCSPKVGSALRPPSLYGQRLCRTNLGRNLGPATWAGTLGRQLGPEPWAGTLGWQLGPATLDQILLPATIAGHRCRPMLSANVAGQRCWPTLPAKVFFLSVYSINSENL